MAQALARGIPAPARPRAARTVPLSPVTRRILVAAPAPDALPVRRLRKLNWWLGSVLIYTCVSLGLLLYQGGRLVRHGQVLGQEWLQAKSEQQQALQALARADQPAELERLARERLGFVGPDEIAIRLIVHP